MYLCSAENACNNKTLRLLNINLKTYWNSIFTIYFINLLHLWTLTSIRSSTDAYSWFNRNSPLSILEFSNPIEVNKNWQKNLYHHHDEVYNQTNLNSFMCNKAQSALHGPPQQCCSSSAERIVSGWCSRKAWCWTKQVKDLAATTYSWIKE